MLQDLDLKYLGYVVAAWLITGVLQAVGAFALGMAAGLPEADNFDTPEDAEEEDD